MKEKAEAHASAFLLPASFLLSKRLLRDSRRSDKKPNTSALVGAAASNSRMAGQAATLPFSPHCGGKEARLRGIASRASEPKPTHLAEL
jgi:hypothetical protein